MLVQACDNRVGWGNHSNRRADIYDILGMPNIYSDREFAMKKKSGTITYYIEVPVEVSYTRYPGERATMIYQGYPAHIEVDWIKYPTDSEMAGILEQHAERIREACFEDLEE